MSRRPRCSNFARLLVGAALGACALIGAGCGAPRSGAVSETGPCAQVIPLAQGVADSQSRLISARAVNRKQLRTLLVAFDRSSRNGRPPGSQGHQPHRRVEDRRAPARPSALPRKACVLIYRGHFREPSRPTAAGSPRYLVLLIRVRHPALLRSLALDRVLRAITRGA